MISSDASRRDAWDVFVSYSRRDKAWVLSVLEALQARHLEFTGEELAIFFDERDILPAEPWRTRLHEGLRRSHFLIAFLSKHYIESPNCVWEWEHFERHERRRGLYGEAIAPIFFATSPDRVTRAAEEQAIRRWLGERRWRNDLKLFAPDDAVPLVPTGEDLLQLEAMRRRLGQLDEAIIRKRQLALAAFASPSTIPVHNAKFCGREAELRTLRLELQSRPAVVTCGLGGIGKSALAFEYAHVFAHAYAGGRYWIPCAGWPTLAAALLALGGSAHSPLGAHGLRWEPSAPEAERLAAVRRWLASPVPQPGAKLLVLDDVDAPDFLTPSYRPGAAALLPEAATAGTQVVHLLATARGEVRHAVRCPLDELGEDAAVEVVRRHCASDDDAPGLAPRRVLSEADLTLVREIVRLLGGFTLAVEAVAVHLAEKPEVSLAGYCDLLRTHGIDELDTTATRDHVQLHLHREKLLSLTLEPTLAALDDRETLALGYASVLPPDCVPLAWVRALVAEKHPAIASAAEPGREDQHPWTLLCQHLRTLRLLVPHGDGLRAASTPHVARLHRLVGQVVRQRIDDPAGARGEALLMARTLSKELYKRFFTAEASAWRPALHSILADWDRKTPAPIHVAWADLANELGLLEQCFGNNAAARDWFAEAISTARTAMGGELPLFAIFYGNLGMTERALGHYDEARRLFTHAIDLCSRPLEINLPTLAGCYVNLALLEKSLGNFTEAKVLIDQALELEEKFLPAVDIALAIHYGHLADIEQGLGHQTNARALNTRARLILEKRPEADPSSLAMCYSNLAFTELDLGNLSEAQELVRLAARIDETSHVDDHPDLAMRLRTRALVERRSGNLSAARELLQKATHILTKSGHADQTALYRDLAEIESAAGNEEPAREFAARAADNAEKTFGPAHPTTASHYSRLAALDRSLGRLQAAHDLNAHVIAIYEQDPVRHYAALHDAYVEIAHLELELKQPVRAGQWMWKAYALLLNHAGAQDPRTVEIAEATLAFAESYPTEAKSIEAGHTTPVFSPIFVLLLGFALCVVAVTSLVFAILAYRNFGTDRLLRPALAFVFASLVLGRLRLPLYRPMYAYKKLRGLRRLNLMLFTFCVYWDRGPCWFPSYRSRLAAYGLVPPAKKADDRT